MNYYNEIDPYCTAWLKELIAAKLIPRGDIDGRQIQQVQPYELNGYAQCHFFAGLGGWPYAARLAGWPDYMPLWTGSCPCQPFSGAGKRQGTSDPRHLWPDFHRIIRGGRPPVVMGEQVAGAAGYEWFDGVYADLEKESYEARTVDIPACSVNAPHIRNRLYWVAHPRSAKWGQDAEGRRYVDDGANPGRQEAAGGLSLAGTGIDWLENADHAGSPSEFTGESNQEYSDSDAGSPDPGHTGQRSGGKAGGLADAKDSQRRPAGGAPDGGWWPSQTGGPSGSTSDCWKDWELIGPDPNGKYRRIKPGIRLLAHGVPARVAKLRSLGNAIVPQVAAEVIRAYMEVYGVV